MPRLTAESTSARRAEIVDATIRVMSRKGVAYTSIADISAESGLSSGSIYSHFSGRAEIGMQAAEVIIGRRVALALAGTSSAAHPRSPADVLAAFLHSIRSEVPLDVVIQLWAEATIDPELHTVVEHAMQLIRTSMSAAILPWVQAQHPALDDSAANDRAQRIAESMTALAQGYIVRCALFSETPDFPQYASGLREALR